MCHIGLKSRSPCSPPSATSCLSTGGQRGEFDVSSLLQKRSSKSLSRFPGYLSKFLDVKFADVPNGLSAFSKASHAP